MAAVLPSIPAKRYFTIGEVGELCDVKPHVLRYWEQEFTQLRPMKRRGNRRYYQHHEVLMIRRIRELLYDQGFTISGARNKLHDVAEVGGKLEPSMAPAEVSSVSAPVGQNAPGAVQDRAATASALDSSQQLHLLRRELFEIRDLLLVIP